MTYVKVQTYWKFFVCIEMCQTKRNSVHYLAPLQVLSHIQTFQLPVPYQSAFISGSQRHPYSHRNFSLINLLESSTFQALEMLFTFGFYCSVAKTVKDLLKSYSGLLPFQILLHDSHLLLPVHTLQPTAVSFAIAKTLYDLRIKSRNICLLLL